MGGVTKMLEKKYEMGSRQAQAAPPTAEALNKALLDQLRQDWEEHKRSAEEVPELGFGAFLQRHWQKLLQHQRSFAGAATGASAHARELTTAEEEPQLPVAAPLDSFALVLAGEGAACATFNSLVLSGAGVRLTSGSLAPVAATASFLVEGGSQLLPLPLHVLPPGPGRDGKLVVRVLHGPLARGAAS